MRFTMYPDSGYNGAHAQSVCTRPFSPRWEGPGDEATVPQDPLGLFTLFFDDSLVQMIVDETNRYTEQVLQGTDKVWSITKEEIHAYMGLMILMGINHLPEIRDYWSVSEYFRYAPIADRISRDRFEITHFSHCVDNDSLHFLTHL